MLRQIEVFENAARVAPVLRCRDEKSDPQRPQCVERSRDPLVDVILEGADRGISLEVEPHQRLHVLRADQLGETVAQRRPDHPS